MPDASVMSVALRLLARREYSALRLRDKLLKKGYAGSQVTDALAQLQADNWQSDDRYCAAYMRQLIELGQGPRRIVYQLKQHGIAGSCIDRHLSVDEAFWLQQACQVWEKRFGVLPCSIADKAKQQRFLLYRGFSPSVVNQLWVQVAKTHDKEK